MHVVIIIFCHSMHTFRRNIIILSRLNSLCAGAWKFKSRLFANKIDYPWLYYINIYIQGTGDLVRLKKENLAPFSSNVFILFRRGGYYNIAVVYCEKVTSNFSLLLLDFTRFRISLFFFLPHIFPFWFHRFSTLGGLFRPFFPHLLSLSFRYNFPRRLYDVARQ